MAKARNVISPEEAAELKRLYANLADASKNANAVLRKSGMASVAFLEADKQLGAIVRRIKEIHGVAGNHWMAI
jgi:hypothetical protein